MEFIKKTIGPESAKILLQFNEGNRKVSDSHVSFLAAEMKKGNFLKTSETIKISKTGRLLDGQHRLHAIIKSGVEIDMVICEGLEDDIFHVLDTGKVRQAKDVLSIKKVQNAAETAASARIIISINTNKFFNPTRISNGDILKFVEENEELIEIVDHSHKNNRKFRMMTNSAVSALYFMFSKINHSACEDFFEKYFSGIDLQKEHPIYHLRDKLIRDSVSKSKLSQNNKIILVATVWNIYRRGSTIKKLEFQTEKFPKLI